MKTRPKKDSDTLGEVKSGIERLTQILSTYLSAFEERLSKIEKQVGNLDFRLTSFEKGTMKTASGPTAIRVPSGMVQDATRTEPIIPKKQPVVEPPSISPEPSKSPKVTPPKSTPTIPKVESRIQVETVSVPQKGLETPPMSDIPLSKETPIAENFYDELKTRLTTKSVASPSESIYATAAGTVTQTVTKQTVRTPAREGTFEKSEEDIKKVLERLKESIKQVK